MAFIEDFFLNRERIRKVLLYKIEAELHMDLPARQALENPTEQSGVEASVTTWMDHYRVLRGKNLTTTVRTRLVKAIINGASEIKRDLAASSIVERHTEIQTLCNSVEGIKLKDKDGNERDRDFTSLASKLLWLLHPSVVPIFDSQAWCATNVIARLVDKVPTDDPQAKSDSILNAYCAFLKLHTICFADLYNPIDKIISEDFGKIFEDAPRKNSTSIKKKDAERQYANHMTVIDQLLWHLGSEVQVEECLTKRIRKRRARNRQQV